MRKHERENRIKKEREQTERERERERESKEEADRQTEVGVCGMWFGKIFYCPRISMSFTDTKIHYVL
jgi:hypothetical protein